jgi:hypothetical protein
VAVFCEDIVEPSGSIKNRQFPDQLSDYQHSKEGPVSWSCIFVISTMNVRLSCVIVV